MSTEVKSLSVRVAKLENSKDNFSKDTVENVKTVNSKVEDLKRENDAIKIEKKKLFDTITDLRCRGYIDNLLFHGIPETEDDTSENCIDTVASICDDKLELNDIKHTITKAHRLGQKKAGQARPIIVRFNDSNARSQVRSNSYKLKNTNVGISQQYPKDVNDRRKRLVPLYKEAKLQKKKAVLINDKLYVDGERVFAEESVNDNSGDTEVKGVWN
ncbi:Hypothetical predicted protein [Mytilus galloprovincialis]|uniref:Uncharacterized protein n=1 Tax=Mytilus galloprovincialis TaxID=29158 RepID=A0A8B6GX18_MYTGA|nr:Hypothetical predicted protein [Mytilus galloprovincialis]